MFIHLHGLLVLHYACTANGMDFLEWPIFVLVAKVGPRGPNLGK